MPDQIINQDMILGEITVRYPKTAKIMLEYGLHCVGCSGNSFDTIYAGCKLHGMTDEEIEELVDRLNKEVCA